MLFYHLMSQLTIVITNNSDAAVSGVAVGGFVPTGLGGSLRADGFGESRARRPLKSKPSK